MLSLEAALEQILAGSPRLPAESLPLAAARGRWLVRDVASPTDLPAFDNSAMDGYAVRCCDLTNASTQAPVRLRCVGEVAAGGASDRPLASGECLRIFTGAPVPVGADAVVMQEDTRVDPAQAEAVWVHESVRPWENVRFRGEDVKAGSVVASAGGRLTFAELGLLGAVGCSAVDVGGRPKVGLLATGDELVEPGDGLRPGQIFESNRLMIQALAAEVGCTTRLFPIVRDSLPVTRSALVEAFAECDVVITTGGVSVGEHDHVKMAFEAMGGKLELWRIAIRPGKPLAWGRLGQQPFFGLPGNPVSAVVTFLLLVRPALIQLQGGTDLALPRVFGTLAQAVSNPGNRRHFMRVTLGSSGEVSPAGVQGSHVMSGLTQAIGLLDVPPDSFWEVGRPVAILRFP